MVPPFVPTPVSPLHLVESSRATWPTSPLEFHRCMCRRTSAPARCDPHGDLESPILKDRTSRPCATFASEVFAEGFKSGDSEAAAVSEAADDGGVGVGSLARPQFGLDGFTRTRERVAASLTTSVFVPAAGNGTQPRPPPRAASSVASDICCAVSNALPPRCTPHRATHLSLSSKLCGTSSWKRRKFTSCLASPGRARRMMRTNWCDHRISWGR